MPPAEGRLRYLVDYHRRGFERLASIWDWVQERTEAFNENGRIRARRTWALTGDEIELAFTVNAVFAALDSIERAGGSGAEEQLNR